MNWREILIAWIEQKPHKWGDRFPKSVNERHEPRALLWVWRSHILSSKKILTISKSFHPKYTEMKAEKDNNYCDHKSEP